MRPAPKTQAAGQPARPVAASAERAPLTIELPGDLVRQISMQVARLLDERQPPSTGGWLRGAARIDCPVSRVYALVSARRIPVQRDGSNLLARQSDLDAWICAGGAIRP
jgi:hypothetical protein